MKIKTEFVTNSSSSSFVVLFDKKITKFEDFEHLISRYTKAQQVLKDALNQKPVVVDSSDPKIIEIVSTLLSYGYIDEIKSYSDYQDDFCKREGIVVKDMYANRVWMQAFYDEYEAMQTRLCIKKAIEFLKDNDGKFMYIFHYGDEDGQFMSEMEHGGTFKELQHLTINKH